VRAEKTEHDPNELYEGRRLDVIAARWDTKAADWDKALSNPECHLNEDHAYERFLLHVEEVIKTRREFCHKQGVIDAGCATGLVLARIIAAFAWGLGIDISPQMIRTAQAKHIPNAKFVIGDCFNLSSIVPAGAILSRGVLLSHYGHHHGKELLQSARGALVNGGFIICDYLNKEGRAKSKHAPENKTYFDPGEVRALARDAGFVKITIFGELDRRVGILMAE
jgi:SAM-dependent methyltransferase